MKKKQLSKVISSGDIYITPGVKDSVPSIDMNRSIMRHICCDWGDVCEEDWESNNHSAEEGARVLSSYVASNGKKFWIVTEADRSATTILLPEEY
jgi:hypothetical protein